MHILKKAHFPLYLNSPHILSILLVDRVVILGWFSVLNELEFNIFWNLERFNFMRVLKSNILFSLWRKVFVFIVQDEWGNENVLELFVVLSQKAILSPMVMVINYNSSFDYLFFRSMIVSAQKFQTCCSSKSRVHREESEYYSILFHIEWLLDWTFGGKFWK